MSEAKSYDIAAILSALPHRYPLLLVDRVASLEIGEEIRAIKAVSFNEQFFQGHFPGRPIMPGVLQIEALALEIDPTSHPAWTGGKQQIQEGGRVAQFNKRFGGLSLKKG